MQGRARQETGRLGTTWKAVVIYDDFELAGQATALLERVALRTDAAMQWDIQPWRLDLWRSAAMAEIVLGESADAVLLIFALRQNRSLPEVLSAWLERWAVRRRRQDVAVLLLSPREETWPQPLGTELKEFAEWHDMAFLVKRNGWDDGQAGPLAAWLRPRNLLAGRQLSSLARRPPTLREWGINE